MAKDCPCSMKHKKKKGSKVKGKKPKNWIDGVEQRPPGLIHDPAFPNLFKLFTGTTAPVSNAIPVKFEGAPYTPYSPQKPRPSVVPKEELIELLEEAENDVPFDDPKTAAVLRGAANTIRKGETGEPERLAERMLETQSPKHLPKLRDLQKRGEKGTSIKAQMEAAYKKGKVVHTPTKLKRPGSAPPRASSSTDKE